MKNEGVFQKKKISLLCSGNSFPHPPLPSSPSSSIVLHPKKGEADEKMSDGSRKEDCDNLYRKKESSAEGYIMHLIHETKVDLIVAK